MATVTGAADVRSNASLPKGTPQSCRWGHVTLFLAYPVWLSAWDAPWSCLHPAHQGPLEVTDTCTTCPDWTRARSPDDR